jgi:hypothetical protein
MCANSRLGVARRRASIASAAVSNRCLACSRKRSGSVQLRLVHETSTGGSSSDSCPYQIGDGLRPRPSPASDVAPPQLLPHRSLQF